jgi:undecaprenyl-diphosphatase
MGEWLQSLVPWGTEFIVWAQSLSNDWLDAVFKFFTLLGYEQFVFLPVLFVYWCLDKRTGIGLAYASLLSAWVNNAIKYIFRIPRPSDPRIRTPWPETNPSFPSGHAQNAMVSWGYLAYRFRNPVLWIVSAILIAGIGLSRVVLGVHFPQDVIGGWLIGLVVLAVYVWAEKPVGRWVGRQRPGVQLLLAVGGPVALIFLHPPGTLDHYPAAEAITAMATLAGLGVGLVMERLWVGFQVEGDWRRRALRFLLGLALALLLYAVPRALAPQHLPYGLEATVRFVRYAFVGWAVAFLAPWVFVRLRLARPADRTLPHNSSPLV